MLENNLKKKSHPLFTVFLFCISLPAWLLAGACGLGGDEPRVSCSFSFGLFFFVVKIL